MKRLKFNKPALGSLRELQGLTQEQLADKVGVDRSAISHWESGKSLKQPSAANFKTLCRVLKCKADQLLVVP